VVARFQLWLGAALAAAVSDAPIHAADRLRAAGDDGVALEGVGKDPAAEQIWVAAINDTTIAPRDRKNLIEDLNETGFDDPRNLTPDDLPLIENRIAIIEQLYPSAVDDTNVAAFDEAYKDLLAMRARLTGQ